MIKQLRMDPLFCGTSILTCQLFRGLLVILLFFLFSDCHVICDMNFPMTCYREVNRCADVLARKGAEQDIDFLSFLSPPEDILNVFMDDFSGMHFNRQCSDPVVMV